MRKLSVTPFPDHSTVISPEDIGAVVRAARTTAGMTLEEAALTVQVAKQTLQNLEKGKGTVSLALAFKVLTGLGIRLRWQVPEGANPAIRNKDVPDAS
mgnify:CR=1 FL=1